MMLLAIVFVDLHALDYDSELDSLKLKLIVAEGADKVDVLYELAKHTAPWDQEQSKMYIDEARRLMDGINDPLRQAKMRL